MGNCNLGIPFLELGFSVTLFASYIEELSQKRLHEKQGPEELVPENSVRVLRSDYNNTVTRAIWDCNHSYCDRMVLGPS